MKKILFLVFTLFLISKSYSQAGEWATISYSYSKGPVSPEYQYNFIILINETGAGKLTYTKSSITKEYDFAVGKKGLNKLNKALMKSKVFVLSEENLKSDKNITGGPQKDLLINRLQYATQDTKPATIQVPSQVNVKYSDNINKLYETIEGLVSPDIWDKARSQ
ncbi:MAG: hypothetical protein ABI792_05155 [bacterium]